MAETVFSVDALAVPPLALGAEARSLSESGAGEWLVEFADGEFVPWVSGNRGLIRALADATDKPVWAHLRTAQPERLIPWLADSECAGIAVQVEACTHANRTLNQIRELGIEVGVALCAATPLTQLDYLLPLISRVLLVCSEPGPQGEIAVESAQERVRILADHARNLPRRLTVHATGALDVKTAAKLASLGAHVVTVGAPAFVTGLSPEAALKKFIDGTRVQGVLA